MCFNTPSIFDMSRIRNQSCVNYLDAVGSNHSRVKTAKSENVGLPLPHDTDCANLTLRRLFGTKCLGLSAHCPLSIHTNSLKTRWLLWIIVSKSVSCCGYKGQSCCSGRSDLHVWPVPGGVEARLQCGGRGHGVDHLDPGRSHSLLRYDHISPTTELCVQTSCWSRRE